MAVKKKETASSASQTKVAPKKAAPKKAAPKTTTTTKKAAAPKAKAATPKKAAPKKAAPVKLTDNQTDLLRKVHTAGTSGLAAENKALTKNLEALTAKKLIKKGAKNKATGHVHYHVSKAGEKHLGSSSSTSPSSSS
ncbi:MAG: hypothetical protein P4L84_22465 [Isosphaeraceae bacterium]|nr:hypothetical protein [Isosphaeraceae bacterium]